MSISKIKVACGFIFVVVEVGGFLTYLVFKIIIPLESQELLVITLYLLSYKYISTCLKAYWKEALNDLSFANGRQHKPDCVLEEHSSLLGYKSNCYLLSHANSALSSVSLLQQVWQSTQSLQN